MDESKQPGGDQELRTSNLVRPRPIQGEGHVDFRGESEGSFPQHHDSFPVAGEAMNDFWSCREASYTAITLNLESNFTRREKKSFPFPLKYIDRNQNYSYEFGCQAREVH